MKLVVVSNPNSRNASRYGATIDVLAGVRHEITPCAASVGALLESRGFSVTLMKFDPYVNVDPGTMSPYQHGEVFVTDDGAEADLDLGHYERFTHTLTSKAQSRT